MIGDLVLRGPSRQLGEVDRQLPRLLVGEPIGERFAGPAGRRRHGLTRAWTIWVPEKRRKIS